MNTSSSSSTNQNQDQLSSSNKRKNSGIHSSDEDISDVVDKDQMERKRHREKKRRFEITHAVERLSKTMIKIDPDAMKTPDSDEFPGSGVRGINGKKSLGQRAGGSLSQSFHRSLNRTDVISSACDLMERLYKDNKRLKEEVRLLERDGNLSDQARNGIPTAVADGAITPGTSSNDLPNRDTHNIVEDAGPLLNTNDGVLKTKNDSDTIPALILQQHQQQSHRPVSSTVAAAEQLMMRPTHGSSSSARLLQQQAVAVSQGQQQKNDMLQQLSMQIQQLQQQQQVSSMHQNISSSHPRFSIQGMLPHAGNSVFGVGVNAGGFTSLPTDNTGMNFGSMAAPLAQSEDWNQLVLRSLQQQQNSDQLGISVDQISNSAFSNNGTNNAGGFGGSANMGSQGSGFSF